MLLRKVPNNVCNIFWLSLGLSKPVVHKWCPPPGDPNMSVWCVQGAIYSSKQAPSRAFTRSCHAAIVQSWKTVTLLRQVGHPDMPGVCPCALEGYNTTTGFSPNELPQGTSEIKKAAQNSASRPEFRNSEHRVGKFIDRPGHRPTRVGTRPLGS